ncbi:hypothetical protein [Thalassotalea crassostreae]|uniref:hypothetical protein n=1 Tax=Thalassotalea crassostreae TaxID=1763536 RepID=UPI000838F0D3|nr:hypothetical protein [Thalassotalea crassostreae]
MNNLVIFCADIGSIKANKFGWAAKYLNSNQTLTGTDIEVFVDEISKALDDEYKVAIGFECPLFVPIRSNPIYVNSARNGEGNRSWSAGAGTGALATGLVEVLWVFNKLSDIRRTVSSIEFDWDKFINHKASDLIFLWEAFVTNSAKGNSHTDDAVIAIDKFVSGLPNVNSINAIKEKEVLSLAGAAALRAGLTKDAGILAKPCLVIKA